MFTKIHRTFSVYIPFYAFGQLSQVTPTIREKTDNYAIPLIFSFFFRLANKTTLKKLLGYSNSLLKIAHCFVATCQQLPI